MAQERVAKLKVYRLPLPKCTTQKCKIGLHCENCPCKRCQLSLGELVLTKSKVYRLPQSEVCNAKVQIRLALWELPLQKVPTFLLAQGRAAKSKVYRLPLWKLHNVNVQNRGALWELALQKVPIFSGKALFGPRARRKVQVEVCTLWLCGAP